MNKKELIRNSTAALRESGKKKPVFIPKQVFTISDNNGNTKDFTVKSADKYVIYTTDDVATILDALIYTIQESLKHGEPVTIHGIGSIGLHYRKGRSVRSFTDGNSIEVSGRYVPKFNFGNDLRTCAAIYEKNLGEQIKFPEPVYDESDTDIEDDGDTAMTFEDVDETGGET